MYSGVTKTEHEFPVARYNKLHLLIPLHAFVHPLQWEHCDKSFSSKVVLLSLSRHFCIVHSLLYRLFSLVRHGKRSSWNTKKHFCLVAASSSDRNLPRKLFRHSSVYAKVVPNAFCSRFCALKRFSSFFHLSCSLSQPPFCLHLLVFSFTLVFSPAKPVISTHPSTFIRTSFSKQLCSDFSLFSYSENRYSETDYSFFAAAQKGAYSLL